MSTFITRTQQNYLMLKHNKIVIDLVTGSSLTHCWCGGRGPLQCWQHRRVASITYRCNYVETLFLTSPMSSSGFKPNTCEL